MDPDTCESLFENQNNLNNGQMFFIMLSFIPLAILMPIWIVASFIYTPWIKAQERLALLEDEVEEIPYVEKYNLKKATNDNLKTLDCDKSFVMETTPEGAVLMKYNKKDEGFDYWADKNIKFKHLEVVARKYVTDYLCKDFYVDRKKYMKEKLNKIKEEIETNKKILEEEKNKSEEEKKKERKAETDNTKDDDVFYN